MRRVDRATDAVRVIRLRRQLAELMARKVDEAHEALRQADYEQWVRRTNERIAYWNSVIRSCGKTIK